MDAPKRILVVANETVGGQALIDAVKAHAAAGPVVVSVVCPQNQPKAGYVIYDENVRSAAEQRLNVTLTALRAEGIEARGQVMDPDPYAASMDALAVYGADEIIVSTHPETRSGWLRRGLVDRIRSDVKVPVEHVVVDLEADRGQSTSILVVANETVAGRPLIEFLERRAAKEGPPLRFVVICPQGDHGDPQAQTRLEHTLALLHDEGWEAIGQVMDPDPFTAVQNALQFYPVDEIVISTFPATRSGWLRNDLIERVRDSTTAPVEHVVVDEAEARAGIEATAGDSPDAKREGANA
ncbi:MAG: hypothetical protein H0X05_01845 [Actinobacteria bacterium]|nr:hypothetical protein [Actinomycetota bacterium]